MSFVLGVDLDGVCADYSRGFRRYVATQTGQAVESLTLEHSWGFPEWGLDTDTYQRFHAEAVNGEHLLASLDPIDGAADSLWRLSDAGVWIRIVTHRFYVNWGHATAAGDTVRWLDDNRIPYRDLCFLGAKTEVGADAYVDDGPHNIEALQAAGRRVIIFDQPYNRELPGVRAASWPEVEEIVVEWLAESQGLAEVQLPGIDAGADRLSRRRASDAPDETG